MYFFALLRLLILSLTVGTVSSDMVFLWSNPLQKGRKKLLGI